MTATIGAREPLSWVVREVPGRGRWREAEEWGLVSEASHELRTPLTALRTEVELALLGDRDARGKRAHDPGSGLGLSLVAAIAIAHRGAAAVANPPEGGADAWIALPRA